MGWYGISSQGEYVERRHRGRPVSDALLMELVLRGGREVPMRSYARGGQKWVFGDRSSIVVVGDRWYEGAGMVGCLCPDEPGHSEACSAASRRASKHRWARRANGYGGCGCAACTEIDRFMAATTIEDPYDRVGTEIDRAAASL